MAFLIGSVVCASLVINATPPVWTALLFAWPVAVLTILFILFSKWYDRVMMRLICLATPHNITVEIGSWAHIVCLHNQARAKDFFQGVFTRGFSETLYIPTVLNYVLGFNIGHGSEIDDCEYFTEKSISVGENCMIPVDGP